MKSKSKRLANEDWNFSCPEDQLSLCFVYEYAREFLRRSKIDKHEFFQKTSIEDFAKEGIHDSRGYHLQALKIFQEFPDCPFLKIPMSKRTALLEMNPRLCERPERPLAYLTPRINFIRDQEQIRWIYRWLWMPLRERMQRRLGGSLGWTLPQSREEATAEGFPEAKTEEPKIVGTSEFVIMHLDWGMTDEKLKKDFAALLKRNRPQAMAAKAFTGKTSPKDKLKFLAALRLLDAMSVKEAEACSAKVHPKEDPLYWDSSEWYSAKVKALEVIRSLFSPVFTGL